MATQLIPVVFDATLLGLVQDFSCGDEPHERELADWIRNDALQAIARGTKVWLYATPTKEIVGFGSIGISRWQYPDPTQKPKVALAVIPAVAIQTTFWGQPPGPPQDRYSSQILDHLVLEAARLPLDVPVLALFVHPDNQRAVKFYQRSGFRPFPRIYKDPASGVEYVSMIRSIVLATP